MYPPNALLYQPLIGVAAVARVVVNNAAEMRTNLFIFSILILKKLPHVSDLTFFCKQVQYFFRYHGCFVVIFFK